jgi:acyl-CoA hydrolase
MRMVSPFKSESTSAAEAGPSVDHDLAAADAISFRTPYQAEKVMRKTINDGKVEHLDVHLSHLPQQIANGIFAPIHFAIIEASDITEDGPSILRAL